MMSYWRLLMAALAVFFAATLLLVNSWDSAEFDEPGRDGRGRDSENPKPGEFSLSQISLHRTRTFSASEIPRAIGKARGSPHNVGNLALGTLMALCATLSFTGFGEDADSHKFEKAFWFGDNDPMDSGVATSNDPKCRDIRDADCTSSDRFAGAGGDSTGHQPPQADVDVFAQVVAQADVSPVMPREHTGDCHHKRLPQIEESTCELATPRTNLVFRDSRRAFAEALDELDWANERQQSLSKSTGPRRVFESSRRAFAEELEEIDAEDARRSQSTC